MNSHRGQSNDTPMFALVLLIVPLLLLVAAFVAYAWANRANEPTPAPTTEPAAVEIGPSDAGGAEPAAPAPSDGGGEQGTGLIGDVLVPAAPVAPKPIPAAPEPEAPAIGVDPATVVIPDEVAAAFTSANTDTAPAQIVALQGDSLPAPAATPIDRAPTVEETLAPIWDTLSPSMQTYATEQHAIWQNPAATKPQQDAAYKNIFALTPTAPTDNTYVLGNNETVTVDTKGKWGTYIYNMEVIGTDVGLSGETGMVISLDRWIDIPLTNPDFDVTIGTNIIYTLTPNPTNPDEWLIDGISWHAAPAEKVNK